MSKKNKADGWGFVYSTDPDFAFHYEKQEQATLPPNQQKLRVRLETKHRGGKTVTVIAGFIGLDKDAEQLCKKLKNVCGTGGAYKDGELIIQGDHRIKVVQYLQTAGYANTK